MHNQYSTTTSNKRENFCLSNIFSYIPTNIINFPPIISVLRLDGIIKSGKGGLNITSLNPLIEKAFANKRTAAVCLLINSPGGSPVQSELIARRIIELSKQKNIPVFSFVEDVAASGGYWLACAGQKIYASKSSIVGSIGVISAGFGFHEMIKKIGVERRVYTHGKNKSILDQFEPTKDKDIKIIKQIQSHIHENFISYVKSRRNNRITQTDDTIFNGEFWTGEQALSHGLIDEINDFYSYIYSEFGDKVKIRYLSPKTSFLKKILGVNTREAISQIFDKSEEHIAQKRYDFF